MTLTAINCIHRRDKAGNLKVIEPGKAFEPKDDAERQRLIDAGAAKAGGKVEKSAPTTEGKVEKSAPTTEGKVEKSAPTTEVKVEQPTATTKTDKGFDDMTKAELVKFAEDNGIEIDKTAAKAEVLETIKADQAADDELV